MKGWSAGQVAVCVGRPIEKLLSFPLPATAAGAAWLLALFERKGEE